MVLETQSTLTRLLDNKILEVFMAYNNLTNSYFNPYNYYGAGAYQPTFVPNQMQNTNNAQHTTNTEPVIQGVVFLSSNDVQSYGVAPNGRVLIMDRDKSVFYIKSADSLGLATISAYKFEPIPDNNDKTEIEGETIPTDEFVKKSELESLKSEFESSLEDLKKSVIKKVLDNEK